MEEKKLMQRDILIFLLCFFCYHGLSWGGGGIWYLIKYKK
jgi:hypothetical protein